MASRSPSIDDPLTGQHLTFTHTAGDTRDASLRAIVRLEPAGFVPRHLHIRQDEQLEVLTGSIQLPTGGTARLLNAGDTATVPRRRVHRVANAGTTEASFVLEVDPARRIERTIRLMFATGRALHPFTRHLRPRAPRPSTEVTEPGLLAAPSELAAHPPIDSEGTR
jgi:quercetin dioxygenase-like cupin family protein